LTQTPFAREGSMTFITNWIPFRPSSEFGKWRVSGSGGFPDRRAAIASAASEKMFAKPEGKPSGWPATILEDR
jgi:hypothetical protein